MNDQSEPVYCIRENETVENLQLNGLMLLQKKQGFRFGMDSVLLADFAAIRPGDTVADFGTGSGVLLLLLAGRGKGKKYFGIEIQPEMAEMAARTICMNHMQEQAVILEGNAGEAELLLPPRSVDAVICNPPYGTPGAGLKNPLQARAIARHQEKDTLKAFLKSAHTILKGRGKISMVYPAGQMLVLMQEMQRAGLEPKRIRLVYPYAGKPANLVLLEGVKDAKPTLHPMPPLIIYSRPNVLTNELKSVYHMDEKE